MDNKKLTEKFDIVDKISKHHKPIGLASDHAGYKYKELIKQIFEHSDIDYIDFGAHSEESVDYPDFGHKLAQAIENKVCDYGISLCGSGNGISMTVNKYIDLRAALCWTPEIAKLAREHNDANVLSIPARFVSEEECKLIVKTFFETQFLGGRHERRIEKIKQMPK